MSYDVTIGGRSLNYTYNLSRFFREHIVTPEGEGLHGLHGMTGAQASQYLDRAIASMQRERRNTDEARLRERYEPTNKWGSIYGAALIIAELGVYCREQPSATLFIS